MSDHNRELIRIRMSGENNHAYDHTKYIIFNLEEGLLIDTKRNIIQSKYDFDDSCIYELIIGKLLSYKGWIYIGEYTESADLSKLDLKKIYFDKMKYQKNKKIRYNRTQFHFINIKTGEKFIGTRFEFAEKYKLKLKSVRKITTNKNKIYSRNSLYGWDCINRYEETTCD